MQISPIEALRVALARTPLLPQAYYSLPPEARLNATTVSGLASLEQIRHVIDAVNQTLASGGTFADFQAAVRRRPDLLHLPDHRLDNVFRTNIQTAYNQGRMNQQLQDTRRVYWMYSAINDSRTRPAHRAWNGTILHRDHPWWRTHYAPCGYRCRCSVISLTQAQAAKRGITPDGQIDSTPPDKGFAGQPSTDAAAYRDLVEQAVRDAMNDFPQSAAPAISQWRDSLTLAEQVADTLKRTLPTLSEDVAKQLPAAVLRAEKLGLESPEGLHMAAAYLDEHGADLNNLLARAQTGTAADALAAATVRDAVAELARVAPNAAPVEFVLSHLDAMPLKVGAVVELEGNRLAKAAMPATTAQVRVRVNRGGVDLAELALADAVLLTTGSRYRVLSETMVDGVMLLTLELTNKPATETLY